VGNGTSGSRTGGAAVYGSDGDFYGTTAYGGSNFTGANTGNGTVFKVTTNGLLTPLVWFNGTNGLRPNAGLTLGSDGNFYGTTSAGGTADLGTVYRMTPAGTLTVLHSFTGAPADGSHPWAALIQGTDGHLYGTTYDGGASGRGTVFKITTSGAMTILRAFLGGADGAHLYAPQTAIRIRNGMNPPTPWVPDMATGENPPDGAIIEFIGMGPTARIEAEGK